jgi:hypothetical protein
MSNNDPTRITPSFYGNTFIGSSPDDTADNLIYGLALLKCLRFDACDDDIDMGLFRFAEALQGAAHHLRFSMNKSGDQDARRNAEAKAKMEGVPADEAETHRLTTAAS